MTIRRLSILAGCILCLVVCLRCGPGIQVFTVTEIGSWQFVDGNGATGINKNTGQAASNVQLVTANSKIYINWLETNAGISQLRAAVFNGNDSAPSWSLIDGNAA